MFAVTMEHRFGDKVETKGGIVDGDTPFDAMYNALEKVCGAAPVHLEDNRFQDGCDGEYTVQCVSGVTDEQVKGIGDIFPYLCDGV